MPSLKNIAEPVLSGADVEKEDGMYGDEDGRIVPPYRLAKVPNVFGRARHDGIRTKCAGRAVCRLISPIYCLSTGARFERRLVSR